MNELTLSLLNVDGDGIVERIKSLLFKVRFAEEIISLGRGVGGLGSLCGGGYSAAGIDPLVVGCGSPPPCDAALQKGLHIYNVWEQLARPRLQATPPPACKYRSTILSQIMFESTLHPPSAIRPAEHATLLRLDTPVHKTAYNTSF